MRLDLFDLQLVLHIVETGSFTKGAEHSCISLQAASERIKKLEQRYGVLLFYRHTTGVTLSLAGQRFYQHAHIILQQSHQLQLAMTEFQHKEHHTLTLWCNFSAQSEHLPELLTQYLIAHPQIHIELKEAESIEIIQALEQGTAQLGFISSFFKSDQLVHIEVADDPLVLICSVTHELAQHTSLMLNTILSYPFVGLMQHHSLQQSIETQAKEHHMIIQYRLRLAHFSAIAQVVAKGVGIAIVPQRAAERLKQHYHFQSIKILDAWANRKLLLSSRSFNELAPHYQHFTQFLISQKDEN